MAYSNTTSNGYAMDMDFDLGYNNPYSQTQWNDADASEFLFDSPQPEPLSVPQEKQNTHQTYPPSHSDTQPHTQPHTQLPNLEHGYGAQQQQNTAGPSTTIFSMPSSASESSDHSSSSNSSAQRKRKSSLSSTPPDFLAQDSFMSTSLPSESMYQDSKLFQGQSDNYTTHGGMGEQVYSNPAVGTYNANPITDDNPLMGFNTNDSAEFGHATTMPPSNGIQNPGFSPLFQMNSASSPVMHLPRIICITSTN